MNIASSERDQGEIWHCNSLHRGDSELCSHRCLGTYQDTSIEGNHYFLSFIDDYSRRYWVYTMKHKREVLDLFVEWKKNMEKNTGRKIKVLRSDNGGEYTSDPFLQLCRNEGIERHFTVRETPQQNGMAERMNKTLLEKVCYILSNASMFVISLTSCLRLQ